MNENNNEDNKNEEKYRIDSIFENQNKDDNNKKNPFEISDWQPNKSPKYEFIFDNNDEFIKDYNFDIIP